MQVTARKFDTKMHDLEKAREATRVAQSDWENIFEAITHPTVILDPQRTILSANRATVRVMGMASASEIVGKKCYKVFHRTTEPLAGCPLQTLLESGTFRESRSEVEACGGVFLVSCMPVLDEKGNLQKIIHIATDITDRKRAEEELVVEKAYFENFFHGAPEAVVVGDATGRISKVNKEFTRLFHYTEREAIGRMVDDLIVPQALKDEAGDITVRVAGGERVEVETIRMNKEGEEIHVSLLCQPVVMSGTMVGVYGIYRDITERKRAEEKIKESEETYRNLFHNAQVGLFRTRISDGKILESNEQLAKMFGYDTREEFIAEYVTSRNYVDPGTREKMIEEIKAKGYVENFMARFSRRDGSTFWAQFSARIYPEKGWIEGVAQDITERKAMEDALRRSEQELHDAYFSEATINMILQESLGDLSLKEVLQKVLDMVLSVPWLGLEYMGSISLVGEDAQSLVMQACTNLPDAVKKLCERVPLGTCFCGRAVESSALVCSEHSGEGPVLVGNNVPPYAHCIVPITYKGKTLGVLNLYVKHGHEVRDRERDFLKAVAHTIAGIITRKKSEEQMAYLAYYDALTGLPNRNLFVDRVTQSVARLAHSKKCSAVLVLGIDKFKNVSVTCGFDVCDAVLKTIAQRLLACVRAGDTVARLGDSDYGVLLVDVSEPADIIVVLEKIMQSVSQPFYHGGKEIIVSLSAGVAVYPGDGIDAASLIKSANLAFERAREEGRKTFQFYTEDMNRKATEFVELEKALFHALKNEEFVMHYQPYCDMQTRKVRGLEALIRWERQGFGLVPPGMFIPILEDTRMIIDIGQWIIGHVVAQIQEWQRKGRAVVPVSVNVSLAQFMQKDFVESVLRVIRERGVPPPLLSLEVTESIFLKDISFTKLVLERLRNAGVAVSIDDFGTGFSSLSSLKRLPVDTLKIDMSFIREVVEDPDSANIVSAICDMARSLNLRTIAEGVETEAQWKILRLLRCDMGQGYYFCRPLPADEIERVVFVNGS